MSWQEVITGIVLVAGGLALLGGLILLGLSDLEKVI